MAELQFAAQAYTTRSKQLLSQSCINAFVEPTPKEGKTQMPVYGIPGTNLFARFGPGPIVGLHVFDTQNLLFAMSGSQLWSVTQLGATTLIGETNLGDNLIQMADNGQQLVMVDGSAGWIYQPGGVNQITTVTEGATSLSLPANITGTLNDGDPLVIALDNGASFNTTVNGTVTAADTVITFHDALPSQVTAGAIVLDPLNVLAQIKAAAFMGASTVQYFDGYFVFDAYNTRQFFISAINDGTQYSGLDFATATASSDIVRAVCIYHEQLLIFCRYHTEVWWDTGNLAFPFQRYDAALIARGIASPYALCSEDNTVFWLADDGIMYRLEGFVPKRISTFATEHAWAQYPNLYLDAEMFVINQEGHKFIIVNFPSAPATWCYDIGSGLWHTRVSWGTPWV
jgi:hypothetical protein